MNFTLMRQLLDEYHKNNFDISPRHPDFLPICPKKGHVPKCMEVCKIISNLTMVSAKFVLVIDSIQVFK